MTDVLVVGGGGREHAIVWKLRDSKRIGRILCAPGNAGIAQEAQCVALAADDIDGLADLAQREKIDLTIVGPEAPLTAGLVDEFERRGLRAFGPRAAGAELEASKAFTKAILDEAGVPTASYRTFEDASAAHRHLDEVGAPIVVKADGLAAGKGVTVCENVDEARQAIDAILKDRIFGDAGARVVLEEKLVGEEASFIALTDGRTVLPLATSQDHKRIGDGDTGPNTGGMGAYSPAPVVTEELFEEITRTVLEPTVATLRDRGIVFKGVLYAGLMIDGDRVKVLEYNVRFGDPECQPLLMRLRTDLLDLIDAVIDEKLDRVELQWDQRPAACIVMAAPGYPGTPQTGGTIKGLGEASEIADSFVFHAGTGQAGHDIITKGGRVLGVTALGNNIASAVERAYEATSRITFPGMQIRRDIGRRAIGRDA